MPVREHQSVLGLTLGCGVRIPNLDFAYLKASGLVLCTDCVRESPARYPEPAVRTIQNKARHVLRCGLCGTGCVARDGHALGCRGVD